MGSVSIERMIRVDVFDEGLEKGREEGVHQAKLEMARKMLGSGMSREVVLQSTELSEI